MRNKAIGRSKIDTSFPFRRRLLISHDRLHLGHSCNPSLELKRFNIIQEGLVPIVNSLCRTNQLYKVSALWRLNYCRPQTVVGSILARATTGSHFSRIGSAHVNHAYLQTVHLKRFGLRFVPGRASIWLGHLTHPTINISGHRTSLTVAKIVEHKGSVFAI